ncbi:MAG: thermonuclease family protein [Thermomicrobiales bacterium]
MGRYSDAAVTSRVTRLGRAILPMACRAMWALASCGPAPSDPVDSPTITDAPGEGVRSGELVGYTVAEVVDVIDGDTLRVRLNGERELVRLIGINSPETDGSYSVLHRG